MIRRDSDEKKDAGRAPDGPAINDSIVVPSAPKPPLRWKFTVLTALAATCMKTSQANPSGKPRWAARPRTESASSSGNSLSCMRDADAARTTASVTRCSSSLAAAAAAADFTMMMMIFRFQRSPFSNGQL